ncbi:MAG TPA: hypothetical protein VG248_11585 [Caulobacteraceae bacterium]|jgi:hypothetical protein|nr:hypothetical protein [Caulobacteraceae bacterium]
MRRPDPAPIILFALAGALGLAACSPHRGAGAPARPASAAAQARSDSNALEHYIGDAIGDPSTCVLIVDRTSGKTVYQYGQLFNCVRGLPACDRPGVLTAREALPLATPAGRGASCNTQPDGSRTVGWAEGYVGSHSPNLVYSAVMEGQKALPGHEMEARLADAFQNAGL